MLSDELASVIETVWSEVLRSDVRRLDEGEPCNVRLASVTARIHVLGPAPRTIVFTCSETLGRRLASFMFHVDPEAASAEDVNDAVGEVANMVGGNVKCIFGSPTTLSLPEVEGTGPCGGPAWSFAGAMGEARFDDAGEPFLVAVTAPS
ncbi:MAG: chemotaxis protein CheX [Polyangiaceae bacterium]